MIQFSHIHNSFNQTQLIKRIHFKINQPQLLTLIPPSPSAKTTLLTIINPLHIPTQPTLYLNPITYNTKHNKSQIKLTQQSPILFQNYNLFPHKSP
ncbi:ATP-binding cassette domain-containing protein, partial [Staphylococcus epidermidis]|uniref:ATP-binding cassette domain-containing protein n=1 Tax=Staphylococcus epidermidis TaxID=1282 RepID=UPI0011A8DA04